VPKHDGRTMAGMTAPQLASPAGLRAERREHLAGVAGAHLCRALLDRGWIARIGSGRAVRVTPRGTPGLTELFGHDPAWTACA
jgi:hypothetical protein